MTFYRGYEKVFGIVSNAAFVWLSDNKAYASMYGNSLAEIEIDETLINCPSYCELEEITDELNFDIIDVLYMPCEEFIEKIKSKGYNAYTITDFDYGYLCLLDIRLIQNRI